jgi:membrane protein implicated in regulation of membrane protease activity
MTAEIFRHLSMLLLVAAMAMPGLLALRLVGLAAGVAMVILHSAVAYDGAGLFWAIALTAVIVLRLAVEYRRHRGLPLSGEERLFQEKVVPSLSPAQARRLIDAGQWRDVAAGTTLTRQGEIVKELSFISRGLVDIVVDGHKVSECAAGSLVGEIALSTGDAATATAVCASPVRYLGFETGRLYNLLDRHVDLQDAVELAIQRSLREKIHRLNLAAAHGAGAAAP